MNTKEALNYFLRRCNARRLSFNTLECYKFHLTPFADYCKAHSVEDINEITEMTVIAYLESLRADYSPYTLRGRHIYLKIFLKRLYQWNVIEHDLTEAIILPKKVKRIIPSFSKDEVLDILDSFDKNTFIGYRDYAIMNLFFGTGIRKSELLGIRMKDLQGDFIRILGKGDKERLVPVGDKLGRVLTRYVRMRKSSNEYLFIAGNGNHLTPSGLNVIFRRLKENKAKWSTRVSAHTCRHTFAKLFLLNGGDLFSLQKILGHEDISTTRVYIDLNKNEMKFQNDKFNPLENLGWKYT